VFGPWGAAAAFVENKDTQGGFHRTGGRRFTCQAASRKAHAYIHVPGSRVLFLDPKIPISFQKREIIFIPVL